MTILSGMGGILGPGAAMPGTEKVKTSRLREHTLVHGNLKMLIH